MLVKATGVEMNSKQISLIVRWHQKVIDTGVKLLALSCFDNTRYVSHRNAIEDDICSFDSLRTEITIDVIDLLHEYCFFLRKLIERTDLVKIAKEIHPHSDKSNVAINVGSLGEETVELSGNSFWWILGRVIHSRSVMVLGGENSELIVYADGKTREYQDGFQFVEVSSEKDCSETSHVFHIPSLVSAYTNSKLNYEMAKTIREQTM